MNHLQRRYLIATAGLIFAGLMLLIVPPALFDVSSSGAGRYGWIAFAGLGALAAAALLPAWLMMGSLLRRLKAVSRALEHAGGEGPESELGAKTDLGELAGAFETIRSRLSAHAASRELFERLFSSMNEALLVTDFGGIICRANPAALEMVGSPSAELIGRPIDEVLQPDGHERVRPGSTVMTPREGVLVRQDGSKVPVSFTVSEVSSRQGGIDGHVYAAQNIRERKKVEQRIRYLARTDPLTKISNRMQFQHQLQHGIARARHSGQYLAILYLDIDRFKDINDTFGHAAGDTSLEIFARRLCAELPHGAVAGRLAGDEFAVLVGGFQQLDRVLEELTGTASKVLRSIGRPFQIQTQEIFMTASMGIALYPRDGDNVIDLLRNADAALYRAKKAGGNCFELYSSDMNTAAVERLMLKSKLRRAFERNELRLHYQPKYSLKTGRIAGAEALLRWDLPERGLVFPADFIPLAEETNLILQIGDWVLNQVCADYRRWQRSLPSPGKVSLNLSLRQLQQQQFLDSVRKTFRLHGVSPTCLELEITETTLMEDADRAIRILDSLYGMGLHLAIDDFGTGYSSLSALQHFPISTLKIDQSFVRDVAIDRDDAAIVATIIQMARSLGLEVVAEGVESQQQVEFLRQHGCDLAQGRFFGNAMTADEYLALLIAEAEGSAHSKALLA